MKRLRLFFLTLCTVLASTFANAVTVTVNIDDASLAILNLCDEYGNSTKTFSLENGSNTLQFDCTETDYLKLQKTDYGKFLSVKFNNTPIETSGYYYNIHNISNGGTLDIVTKATDKPKVTFSFADALANSAVSYLRIGNKIIRDNNSNKITSPIEASAGDDLEIRLNSTDYKITTFAINGVAVEKTSYTGPLYEDINISIAAEKWQKFNITVNVNDTENTSVYKYANEIEGNLLSLTNGENTVALKGDVDRISVVPAEKKVVTVKRNGNIEAVGSAVSVTVLVTAGDVIDITTDVAHFATINIDYANRIILTQDDRTIKLYDGRNTNISEGDYTIKAAEGYSITTMTINNENEVTPKNGVYSFTLKENDFMNIATTVSTGIHEPMNSDSATLSSPAFNIAGQKVKTDAKGLIIRNGRKIINK